MKLTNYYSYIQRLFFLKTKNKEDAEDYTQEFFIYYWNNRRKINDHISLKFIHKAVGFWFSHMYQSNRAKKRMNNTISLDSILYEPNYPAPMEEYVYTKQLWTMVEKIARPKVKAAVKFLIHHGDFRANETMRIMFMRYRRTLCL